MISYIIKHSKDGENAEFHQFNNKIVFPTYTITNLVIRNKL